MNNEEIKQNLNEILKQDLPWENLKGKTVAVSGTNGFIASWLCKVLGHTGIVLLPLNKPYCDINKELAGLEDLKIDYIFHAASYASPIKFKENPVEVILPNTIGTYNLLELARKNNAEFIFFSTSGVYGWHPEYEYPLSEEMFGSLNCAKVENCYLESKRLGEQLCVSYNYKYNIPIKILRLGICYGPGLKLNNDGRVMNTFIEKVLAKEDLTVYNEHVYRSFMYITDVLSAIFHVLFYGENGPYNIAAEKEITVLELAKIFCKLYPDSKLIHEEREDRLSVDFSRTWMDVTKLKELGWSQQVPIENGIMKTMENYL